MMRLRLILLLAVLALPLSAFAQEAVSGTEALGILRVERDPALGGMAGAGSSLADRSKAFAALSNPAMLPFSEGKVAAGVSYALVNPKLSKGQAISAGAAVRLGKLSLSGAFVRQGNAPVDLGEGPFTPVDMIVAGAAGLGIGEHFAMGLRLKYAQQKFLSDYSVSGTAFGVMGQYHHEYFNVSAGLVDFGGKVKGDGDAEYSLPTSVRLAGDGSLPIGDHRLSLAADVDYYFSKNYSAAIGVTYSFRECAFVRAGYRYSSPAAVQPSHLSVGAGVRFFGVSLDVSYLLLNENIGGTLCTALAYCF